MKNQTYPAFEKWLIRTAKDVQLKMEVPLDIQVIMAFYLQRKCQEQHQMAFDLMGSVNEDGRINPETFLQCATIILERNKD